MLQSSGMVEAKARLQTAAFVRHALIHLALSMTALALFTSLEIWHLRTISALALLTGAHIALDVGKSALIKRQPSLNNAVVFLADQFLHLIVVGAATFVAVGFMPPFDAWSNRWMDSRDSFLLIILVISLTVFPTGYLIRYMLTPWSKELAESGDDNEATDGNIDGLTNAGLYLGWLERTLLLVAFSVGSLTAVGLIVGAKSIARFPAFKTRAFAEYFLMGTLLSVAIAWIGGWILRIVLSSS